MCDCLTVLGGKCDPYLSTNHISTDDGNLPFLVEPVETIYLGLDFHCKTWNSIQGAIANTSKKQIQETYRREVFLKNVWLRW